MEQHLTYRNVTVLSRTDCAILWHDDFQPPSLPHTALCGKYPSEADDSECNIEFGVPIATSDSRVLLGIFAGFSCDGFNQPDLFTGTGDVANWIFQNSYVDGVIAL